MKLAACAEFSMFLQADALDQSLADKTFDLDRVNYFHRVLCMHVGRFTADRTVWRGGTNTCWECADIGAKLLLMLATQQRDETFIIVLIASHQKQEVKVIWQKAPHGGPIPRLGVTPGGRKLYHWIPGVGFPISVP